MPLPLETRRLSSSWGDLTEAAEILRSGGLVAIPTETVYGLAADGLNALAVEKVFAAKSRPRWDPLILHISDARMLQQVVADISPTAQLLINAFWPGPLTLLLPRSQAVPPIVTAGRELAGVRMPAHPVALEIVRRTGRPLAAPSANRFGHISPTSAEHVLADLDGRIDAVVDAGSCRIGVESTVLDPSGERLTVYRQGGVQLSEIEHVTGLPVDLYHRGRKHLKACRRPESAYAITLPGPAWSLSAPSVSCTPLPQPAMPPRRVFCCPVTGTWRALEAGWCAGQIGTMRPGWRGSFTAR